MDAKVAGAIGLVITLIILSLPIIPIQKEVTKYTADYYTFEQEFVREKQVRPFPWFREVTQVQYLVTNTYYADGTFMLNCCFDNGSESGTKTNKVKILAGEQKSVSINSPFSGISKVTLNVVPPYRTVAQKETITVYVNAWYFGWYEVWHAVFP